MAAGTLTGDRVRLIDSTRGAGGNTTIAASLSGTVIALAAESPGTDSAVETARVNMDGRILERLPAWKQNHWFVPALSPSRQLLATAGQGLGRYDIARHSWNPLPNPSRTVVGGGRLHWVGSDTLIAFVQDAAIDSVFQLNTGTGARALLFAEPSGRDISLGGRSRDGRWWLFTLSADTSVQFAEAWVFDATTRTTRKLFDEEVAVREPQLSPDGRLVTYEVREGPRRGLYVRPFATPGVPSAIVSGYVDYYAWSDDGRSIYFVRANRTIEVIDVNTAGEPVGAPRIVVPTSTLEGMSDSYRDVRFVLIPGTREMYVSLNNRRARALVVLQNFEAFAARGR